jgi:DNA modification methylase
MTPLKEGFLDVKTIPKTLSDRFVCPPFSVLDASQGYWQKRKRAWIRLGISGGEGRDVNLYHQKDDARTSTITLAGERPKRGGAKVPHMFTDLGNRDHYRDKEKAKVTASTTVCATDWMKRGPDEGGSIFDPVLAELMFKWFCPVGGSVLDPFAGESTKGIVATTLGFKYTGIELRPEQMAANNAQAAKLGINPEWIQGDSERLNRIIRPERKFDFIFTSPPYYDLEIYSESEKDGSAFETYEKFMVWYHTIFKQAVSHLKDNRFLAIKIGEIRDKKTGAYRNFVGDNISCFMDLGLHYYNEVILITPKGSMPIRAGKQFESGKKLAKGHQNVLVFYKGDLKKVMEAFPNADA